MRTHPSSYKQRVISANFQYFLLKWKIVLLALLLLQSILTAAQVAPQQHQDESTRAPLRLTLQDALARARQYGTQVHSADILAQVAKENRAQAKAATLPSLSMLNQFIYTEGNGTPSGVFVANDGVHVYNEQAWVHEELLSFVRRGEIRVATAAEAVAKAQAGIAQRGLNLTVIQGYYAIVVAQRKVENAESSLKEADQFLDTTQKQEGGGEVAHADVIKAQLQVNQRQRDIQDAQLALQKAKVDLGVLVLPSLALDYAVVDDLANPTAPPELDQVAGEAAATSPDLHTAQAALKQAHLEASVARYGYLPSFGLDFWYGINANQFAAQASGQSTGRSTLPNYLVPNRQNLGYSAAATLTVPVWTWGSIHSKVKQAHFREEQAAFELTAAQRQLQGAITSAYNEVKAAFLQIASLHSSVDLSTESLRLTLLRYRAGEATALEVVDAQTTTDQARNGFDAGLARYRVALADLHNLTGTL
jgi:outer membrane protein TolC